MDLGIAEVQRKTGQEKFHHSGNEIDLRLIDFWQWSVSDLLSNATRGKLAEFLVATALGINQGIRTEWDVYDLTDKDGTRIEIKTPAYLQSWHQEKFSEIKFGIQPTIGWSAETNKFGSELKRHSDFYIFCLLEYKDKSSINPFNLDQWIFYILSTITLDSKVRNQKTLSHKGLLNLNPVKCKFSEIISAVRSLKKDSQQ